MLALKAENISKQYRLGQVGTGTLSHDLNRYWHKIRGKEDPYLKIGEANDRSSKGSSDYVWSLQDINFEIEQGDAVGIIGRNGAGKSTLLKILSKVTQPTTGKIYTRGRIASLLEVGTGFHPEMTGRENIFLNGAILGMTKKEITRKFDEIVDFSGVERYIDTPVKRYSSGMYVRLAFAVAAHLESEILIVDEVLAVGDAEFQKKCLGKMGDVTKGEGRTILFVSHNMGAISNLCNKGILLEKGLIKYEGTTEVAIKKYLETNDKNIPSFNLKDFTSSFNDNILDIIDFKIIQNKINNATTLRPDQDIKVYLKYRVKVSTIGLRIGFDLIHQNSDVTIFRSFHDDLHNNIEIIEEGVYESNFTISSNFLKPSGYIIKMIAGIHNQRWIINNGLDFTFDILNVGTINKNYSDERPGLLMPQTNTTTIKKL